jgi:prevent-host-death family protein
MRIGIRQLKDGELSRAVRRASHGEEVVITDHGRPVARIVPYSPSALPVRVLQLAADGRLELRAPLLGESNPVAMSPGRGTAVDYVREQRR